MVLRLSLFSSLLAIYKKRYLILDEFGKNQIVSKKIRENSGNPQIFIFLGGKGRIFKIGGKPFSFILFSKSGQLS